MRHLVTIGRFSRMTRLSVKALRRYDEAGILRPAWVDPATGYRHYGLEQATRAEAVRLLRSVDMPLTEIRDVLAHDDPALVRKALAGHRARLADRLAHQRRMLAFLEQLIAREEPLVMSYEITTKQVPEQPVLAVRRTTTLEGIPETFAEGFSAIMSFTGPRGIQPSGPPLAVYHDVIDEHTGGDVELCLPVAERTDGGDGVAGTVLPAGEVATTVHRGPYDEIGPAYHTLTGWIAEHGREPAGPPREIYLNDPGEVGPAELLTEIDWPLR